MGMWIGIFIALFVLGSMMALKPSGIDQRLDKLRMSARRLQLNPKLIACPDWIRGKDDEHGRGMMAQYGLVLEGKKLPHARYQAVNGEWRATEGEGIPANFALDKVAIDLPPTIAPFAKGLLIKANSIVIYWEDIAYVRPATNPSYNTSAIEPDLIALKEQLHAWTMQMQH
ncbi:MULTISPECIES: hypothetical protein [unclassified Psychrobacter]|uniref:hypothetical protein n=1 Tax=unclassified Psychrobacter TaxID=196806 RepID=UPI0018F35C47|nr:MULTISPECIES: hypothetical protein [unclassified Psychrobacter]